MRKILIALGILVIGAAILSPVVAALELEPMPGDFTFTFGNQHILVPVLWSLCASLWLALLYLFYRR